MEKFELEKLAVQELSTQELKETNGGWFWHDILIEFGIFDPELPKGWNQA